MLRRLVPFVLLSLLAPTAHAQIQDIATGNPIVINSTTPVAVATLPIEGSGTRDVALTAHVYLEGSNFDGSAYAVGICRGSAGGTLVGLGFWTPGDKSPEQAGNEADVVTVTAFDAAVALPVTYVVCVAKESSGAPSVTAYLHGFNADTAPPGTRLVGLSPLSGIESRAINSTSRVGVGAIEVDAGESSDVSLVAHVVLDGANLGGGYTYDVGLCRGSSSGTLVGRALWRPPVSAGGSGDVVSLTGFDRARSGVQRYVLCVRKFFDEGPNVGASYWGIHASVAPTETTEVGTQSTGLSGKSITSQSFVNLASIETTHARPYDVRLTAHVYLEPPSFSPARYEIGICRGSASGPQVGRTLWRPNRKTNDGGFIGDTVTLTGYDAGRTGDTTYVLCGAKFDSGAPDVTAVTRGLVATVPEPGAAGAGAAAALALAALRRSLRRSPL